MIDADSPLGRKPVYPMLSGGIGDCRGLAVETGIGKMPASQRRQLSSIGTDVDLWC